MKSAVDEAQRDRDEMDQEMNKMQLGYEQERTELQRAHEDKVGRTSFATSFRKNNNKKLEYSETSL